MLRRTLESLQQLRVPADATWRVLLVNNASTDNTERVIDEFLTRLPIVRLFESQLSHSASRNRAIAASRGDLIVWTDDDVRVGVDWLAAYAAAAQADPDRDFWGGPIRPEFVDGQPRWIADNWSTLQGCFAARDLGPSPREFDHRTLPYGANFAVRRAVQAEFPFDDQFGRRGTQAIGGDEIDVLRRMIATHHRGRWVPQAHVDHLIDESRATERYVWRYFWGQAYTNGRLQLQPDGTGARSAGELRRAVRQQRWRYWVTRPWAQSARWLSHLLRWALAAGELAAGDSPYDSIPNRSHAST